MALIDAGAIVPDDANVAEGKEREQRERERQHRLAEACAEQALL